MIDYHNVAKALAFYQNRYGFTYMEVPWIVSEAAISATLPEGIEATRTQNGPLVGSAEQSFIELHLQGKLNPGKFMAATPCFRLEVEDQIHKQYFFKVELIEVLSSPPTFAEQAKLPMRMAEYALDLFINLPNGRPCQIVSTPEGFDIELHGVELGSYGYRRLGDFHWVYGTGYADPRFTYAANLYPEGSSFR